MISMKVDPEGVIEKNILEVCPIPLIRLLKVSRRLCGRQIFVPGWLFGRDNMWQKHMVKPQRSEPSKIVFGACMCNSPDMCSFSIGF